MSFTNTSPFMVPTRSRERGLGTNPISCAANGAAGDSFVLDMATTPVAHSKVCELLCNYDAILIVWQCWQLRRTCTSRREGGGEGSDRVGVVSVTYMCINWLDWRSISAATCIITLLARRSLQIELARRRNLPIPNGWGCDGTGKVRFFFSTQPCTMYL